MSDNQVDSTTEVVDKSESVKTVQEDNTSPIITSISSDSNRQNENEIPVLPSSILVEKEDGNISEDRTEKLIDKNNKTLEIGQIEKPTEADNISTEATDKEQIRKAKKRTQNIDRDSRTKDKYEKENNEKRRRRSKSKEKEKERSRRRYSSRDRDSDRRRHKSGDRKEERYHHESSRKRKKSKSPENKSETNDSRKENRKENSRSRKPSEEIRDKDDDSAHLITARQRRTVDILTSRTGGAYIPPAKLRLLQNEITDKTSAAYQRIAWEALKKSIHGFINKINVDNIGIITRELLTENIIRGRGLLCRSIIQAQTASPTFTHVYAALVAIINSKFPNIGELLLKRLVIQFKRGFRRNDKVICLSASRFIGHLVNQRVAHEILALEILTLLVEAPTDDSVEVAIAFLKECGMKLTEVSAKGINAIFEMLKNILHEGKLDKRVQYMIEVVFQVRKDGFKDHSSILEALELVDEQDQFTHLIMLDEATESMDQLNVFKFDDKYQENEEKYKGLSSELLGSDDDDSDASGSGSDDSNDEENNVSDEGNKADLIIDNTETNLITLRRTIYLTIHSSLDYEECAHKLMKMQLKPGQEMELCHMFLDCCAEQRTYEKFYGLLAQRFCNINKIYIGPFEEIFKSTYTTTHRLDTNRLRNVSKFFAHLLFTDAIGWHVMECILLNEDDTTSSSRIFIKILFQELAEYMGLGKLNDRLKDPTLSEPFSGLFPRDNPKNTRFCINFFTSIGLGGLTDELREFLKSIPKTIPKINHENIDITSSPSSSSDSSTSSDSSDSSSTSSDSSSSDSSSEEEKKRKKKKMSNKKKQKTVKKKKKVEKKNKKHKKKSSKRQSSSSSSSTSSESSSSSSSSSDGSPEKRSKKTNKRNAPTSSVEIVSHKTTALDNNYENNMQPEIQSRNHNNMHRQDRDETKESRRNYDDRDRSRQEKSRRYESRSERRHSRERNDERKMTVSSTTRN